MSHAQHLKLARRMFDGLSGPAFAGERPARVPTAHYRSEEHFALEQREVFGRLPQPVAHASELAQPGDVVTAEVAGVPLVVVRGADGGVRAFRNACRHRGTRLVRDDAPCPRLKAFVCRYHAWTYDLTGRLTHAPHRESFCGEDAGRAGLVAAHAVEGYGFIWASLAPIELAAGLAPLHDELSSLNAAGWTLYRRHTREVAANWKIIIDAFLEAYHLRHLHRETVSRFFLDARFEAERAGENIRAATARRELKDVTDWATVDARQVSTPTYLLFPSSTLVLHPDFYSLLALTPLSAGRTRFTHTMYLDAPSDDPHWAKSFDLIDGQVFGNEDLVIAEEIQKGLQAGADDTLLFGQLEAPAVWFHEALAARLQR